jgi:hypothetical protein
VADGVHLHRVERLLADQLRHGVGELDLASRARLALIENAHHVGLEDVAADDREVRRRLFGLRLFDQAEHLGHCAVLLPG